MSAAATVGPIGEFSFGLRGCDAVCQKAVRSNKITRQAQCSSLVFHALLM